MVGKSDRPVLTLLTGHWLSMLGAGLVTTAAISWLFVLPLSSRGAVANPYIGILLFIVLPIIFFAGLAIIPVGIWLSNRRIRNGLAQVHDRRAVLHRLTWFVVATTLANILIASQLTYRAVEYMDSNQFCGQSCHVMNPQLTAYMTSAHSNVPCAECHIAPGAAGWFRAKMNGTRQLLEVTFHNYPTPIPPALFSGRLVSAQKTCEHCHSAHNSPRYRLRVIRHFTDDAQTKPTNTVLMMRIRGDAVGPGIHGVHLAPGVTIQYAIRDRDRQNIPWVEYRDSRTNTVHTYSTGDVKAGDLVKLPKFEMQCVDCHSRPAHSFEQPDTAVDTALASGDIPANLPFIRKKSVEFLKAPYSSRQEAALRIPGQLASFYKDQNVATVRQAANAVVAIYKRNVFPEMKVTWGTYPNELGHTESTGCFRCHDGGHTASNGSSISQDCNACHQMVAADEPSPEVLKTLGVPTEPSGKP